MKHPTTGRLRTASIARRLTLVALVTALFAPACGKKGPPLPPLVKAPARPDPFVARRLGSVVYLQVRIPTANNDNTTPADVERVEVYALTSAPLPGTALASDDFFKSGTLVASVPVRKPPKEVEEQKPSGKHRHRASTPAPRTPAPPRPPASVENGFDQGDTVVVTEPLGPEQYREVTLKTKKPMPVRHEAQGFRPLDAPPLVPMPARVYVAVAINHKGQKGAVSPQQRVVLAAPASAPSAPTITYTEDGFSVAWTPPADAHAPQASGEDVLESRPIGSRPVYGAFNVYEAPPPPTAGAAKVPLPPVAGGRMPTPANDKPLPAPPLVDKRMAFGKPRCYAVRAVTLFGTEAVEGEASPTACVTPVDTFAPAAPTSLKAVGSEGAVSLIWDANKEADLAGYIVLRSALPNGEFVALTREPVKETTFIDTTATRGVRYAYVIVAVDTSKNRSAPSNRVEESAR